MSNDNMMAAQTRELLTELLGAMLSDTADRAKIAEKLTRGAINSVAALAKKHDLAHVVARFVSEMGIEADAELIAKLQREDYLSVYRNRQMEYALSEICTTLDAAGIDHIPLKGAVIRKYYPYESMRTSCDIDVLIHECDIDAAVAALVAKGYTAGEKNYHDVSLHSPNKIHLELHFSIQENIDSLDLVLSEAWSFAKKAEGHRYEFTPEFLIYHIFAHMTYHFIEGGCGIRSLMDIWVLEHNMGVSYADARELLERAGIYKFASEMHALANKCFSGEELDGLSRSILSYIYSGGVYGNTENKIASFKSKNKGTLAYLVKRLFPRYKVMAISYPVLKKAPILLPFCWVLRRIRAVFGGKSKKFANQIAVATNLDDEKVREVSEIRSHLGI